MSKEKRRVPKLRFPGFTEDWEQRKLIDIAKTFIGLVTTMTENYRDSGTLLIRNSDIKEGQFLFSENPIHLDEEFAEKNKTRRLQIGDVVTVHTGDIGTSAVIEEKEAGAIGFATINTRTDKSILNPYFLATYFNTEKHKCYANSVSTGDGRSNYNIKDFNKLVISVPTLDEQERISVLINDINIIITLHQRKLDNLKLKKKALLQKLFPKNGERYPELRFPGFTDAWEQRKLEDVCNVYDGTHQTPRYTNSGVMFVSVEDIETLESNKYITEEDFKSEFKVFPEYGDILLTRIGDVGSANVILDEIKRAYYVSLALLKPKDINSLFLLALLSSSSVQSEIWRRTLHIAFPKKINKNEINKVIVNQPSIPEQKKIGKLFFSLDQTITLHQRKLDHLQLQKKALLQQMFV